MRIAGERIGRGAAGVLSATAVLAALLAVHGYGQPGQLGLSSAAGIKGGSPSPTASPSATSSPSAAASPTSSAAQKQGPLLSSTAYAPYTYQLYPGSPSSTARTALAGFSYQVVPSGGLVKFTLTVSGGGQAPITHTYPVTDHVYFVEANLGDDSGSTEYNFGDDGLVVTDATGHVQP